ncbi:aldolase/citrate lyase family protein [Phytohabitans suffuscus]|uniref:aldolase/citrate lyase family protein n=1 Tax=Phytohabitans suffuscus TaxID=624315 RepID=UPI002F96ACDA
MADLTEAELHPLIESAAGVENAYRIATAHPAVAGIALGEADLRSDLGISDEAALAWPRGRIVVAARAAGLPHPRCPSTRTSPTWTDWQPPAAWAAGRASSAAPRSTHASYR